MTGFAQNLGGDEVITGMRIDIGEMRSDMRHLAETMTTYMERAESCQQDHEARIRAVETAALAVAQIADIQSRLKIVEGRVITTTGRDRFLEKALNFAIGAIGAIVALLAWRF